MASKPGYELSAAQKEAASSPGYTKLEGVLSPELLERLRNLSERLEAAALAKDAAGEVNTRFPVVRLDCEAVLKVQARVRPPVWCIRG